MAGYARAAGTPAGRTVRALSAMIWAVLTLAGCARNQPHGIAQRYLEYLQQFNYPACYHLLSQQDRTDRTLREFLTEIPLAPDVSPLWFRPILHTMHYELGPEHRNSDGVSAVVPVRVTMPDLPLWERILDAAGADGLGADRAQRSLDTGDYPKFTYDDTIFLIKEHHHWRIVAGFAARDRVVDRHRAAAVQYHQHDYAKAIATYQAMIAELLGQRVTGSQGIAVRYRAELSAIDKIRGQASAAAAYVPKLKLNEVAMRMSEERVPAIFGTVANTGDKPLDEVALAVTWYEGRGKDLRAVNREEHPVVATPLDFTDFNRSVVSLLPGETRRFGFILAAPPQIEQDAAPYVTVSSIAFTQSPAPLPRSHAAKPGAPAPPSASAAGAASSSGPAGTAVAKPQPATASPTPAPAGFHS
jgi:hypothetical protein